MSNMIKSVVRHSRILFPASKTCLVCTFTSQQQQFFSTNPTFRPYNNHRSDAEVLIKKVPVIEVDDVVAVCDGGGGALGHPIEYINLHNAFTDKPQACGYCGLKFAMKHHH